SPTPGTISLRPDGSFAVNGTHAYAEETDITVPYTVTITITQPSFPSIPAAIVRTQANVAEDFTVTTVADSGPGSLRDLILDLNGDHRGGTIIFAIPGPGPYRIALTSPLPAITVPVVIDGTTQPGFSGAPVIELDGSGAGASADGLTVAAGN